MDKVVAHVYNDPIDPECVKWHRVCDYLGGKNYHILDYEGAIKMARDCSHPDAIWLYRTVTELHCNTRSSFFRLTYKDPRGAALFMTSLIRHNKTELVLEAANNGFSEAQYYIAKYGTNFPKELRRKFWMKAVLQDHPRALRTVTTFIPMAKKNVLIKFYKRAVRMGDEYSKCLLIEQLPITDIWRYETYLEACRISDCSRRQLVSDVHWVLEYYIRDGKCIHASVLYVIGRLSYDFMDLVFENGPFKKHLHAANSLFLEWNRLTQNAVMTWLLAKVCSRDVRMIVARMLWETRKEALYDLRYLIKM